LENMVAKFLCCLPLRLGVLVISFLLFLISGAAAALMWMILHFINNDEIHLDELPKDFKTVVIVLGAVYTFSTVLCVLGLLGAIFRKKGFVRLFYVLLCALLAIETAANVVAIVTYYRTRHNPLQQCLNGGDDRFTKNFCDFANNLKNSSQAVIWVTAIVPLIIIGYACYIVSNYIKRLERQKAEEFRFKGVYEPVGLPAPVKDESTVPLTVPETTYPYADATHSFGHHAQTPVPGYYASNKV